MGNISDSSPHIIFKGALITKLILQENGYNTIERTTTDIDGDWCGTPPTMDYLVETVEKALSGFQESFYAKASREYAEGRSAGISIIEKNTDKEIASMDISIKPVIGSKIYYYGEMKINGVLPSEVLADKICVLSSNKLFRRMKDMIDVYALSNCVNINMSEILDICTKKGREIESFSALYSQKRMSNTHIISLGALRENQILKKCILI